MGEMNAALLDDAVAYIDRWVGYQQERREIPGVVAAIAHGETLLLSKGYGYANLEREERVTPEHIFRIASHSKTFTATAVMQLVERGALRLDDPLAAYIPWLMNVTALAEVTVRQALNHTTGIVRNGDDADYWQLDQPFPDDAELRRLVEHGGAVLPPNTSFKYSNIAYGLLGLVIAAASGIPYHDYVRERIIAPLGLRDTGPETDDHARQRLVTGYTVPRFGLPRRPPADADTHALASATGFYSTAPDLCHYAAAHCFGNETLLSDASKREMQQPYWKVPMSPMHYGLGFSVQEIEGQRFVGHGGGFPGHATHTLFDPKECLIAVALTNQAGGPAATLAQGMLKIIAFAGKQAPAAGDATATRACYTGRFVNNWGVTDIAAFGDALVMLHPEADDPTQSVTRLVIEDDHTLRVTEAPGMAAPGEPVRYTHDAAGRPTKIVSGGGSAYPPDIYRARQEGRWNR
jgi:CubicO group peptidase (beta-lactamase class C family)